MSSTLTSLYPTKEHRRSSQELATFFEQTHEQLLAGIETMIADGAPASFFVRNSGSDGAIGFQVDRDGFILIVLSLSSHRGIEAKMRLIRFVFDEDASKDPFEPLIGSFSGGPVK